MKKTVIETDRLYLREMDTDDFEALYAVLADRENMRYYKNQFAEENVKGWIEWCMNCYRDYGFGLWAVCLKENDEMIGDCGLSMQDIDGKLLPEIGFHIRRDLHHKGYAKEAAAAVRDWTFNKRDFQALYSYCSSDNIASYKTAEAIGMHFEKEYTDKYGSLHHVSMISREDWRKNYG
ncbi:MAG: GNAT family N-acetyltransferase [Erysipelotrichaceae bacterium]|nr:GNAT family N-acetyltransferase [Erysipelotrichaceae bacterium]